jgi:hypothetical protein
MPPYRSVSRGARHDMRNHIRHKDTGSELKGSLRPLLHLIEVRMLMGAVVAEVG